MHSPSFAASSNLKGMSSCRNWTPETAETKQEKTTRRGNPAAAKRGKSFPLKFPSEVFKCSTAAGSVSFYPTADQPTDRPSRKWTEGKVFGKKEQLCDASSLAAKKSPILTTPNSKQLVSCGGRREQLFPHPHLQTVGKEWNLNTLWRVF